MTLSPNCWVILSFFRVTFNQQTHTARSSLNKQYNHQLKVKMIFHSFYAALLGVFFQNTQEVKNERFLIMCTRQNNMCECSAYVAFNTATDGQKNIKHETD